MNWNGIKIIAVVGLSDKPERASYRVAKYLQEKGYKIIPVNPVKEEILGEKAYPSITAIPSELTIDVIDVFRKSDAVPEIVEQTIDRGVPILWLQEGIIHEAAAKKAEQAGIKVIMDKCILKEHRKDVISMSYDLVVIGSGPAGLTAALYGARGGLKTLIIEKFMPGGQAALTDEIANYPGFPNGVSGSELMMNFHKQALQHGAEFQMGTVVGIEKRGEMKVIKTDKGELETKSIVISTGAKARKLGVLGEEKFHGRGVSYCATCDGAFFKDQKVAVVGGGDSAVEEAVFLTKFASEVILIHRRDELRAVNALKERAKANEKIKFILDTAVEEIQGDTKVEKIILKNLRNGQTEEVAIDGVFVFVGTEPNTEFLNGNVELNEQGYVVADEFLRTSVPGIFVAGDVRVKFLRQVSTAVGDGAVAAMSAERYVAGL